MKKLVLVLSFLLIGLQSVQTMSAANQGISEYGYDSLNETSGWSVDKIGTIDDAWQAVHETGKHAAIVGWNVTKIPLIPLKHFVLQFIDLFSDAKNIVKHAGLTGFNLFRLGTDIVAAPFVYGYKYPNQTAIAVGALIAAGAVYEGSFLLHDLELVDLSFIFNASGQVV